MSSPDESDVNSSGYKGNSILKLVKLEKQQTVLKAFLGNYKSFIKKLGENNTKCIVYNVLLKKTYAEKKP